jgi:hypothetical protein
MAGIHDPDVIDLVTHDPRTDEVALIIVQTEPWQDGPEQADDLRKKIDTYVAFARDGGLVQEFPQVAEKPIRIQLDCQVAPSRRTTDLLEVAGERLRQNGIKFVVNVLA